MNIPRNHQLGGNTNVSSWSAIAQQTARLTCRLFLNDSDTVHALHIFAKKSKICANTNIFGSKMVAFFTSIV